jgi:hypothetical protein
VSLTLPQGTTCSISASNVRIDGVLVDMTTWTAHAVLRQWSEDGPLVAEWSTSPTGSQGQVVLGNGTAELAITPAMSAAWSWSLGICQCEVTEPGIGGRTARVIDQIVYLDREVVTT